MGPWGAPGCVVYSREYGLGIPSTAVRLEVRVDSYCTTDLRTTAVARRTRVQPAVGRTAVIYCIQPYGCTQGHLTSTIDSKYSDQMPLVYSTYSCTHTYVYIWCGHRAFLWMDGSILDRTTQCKSINAAPPRRAAPRAARPPRPRLRFLQYLRLLIGRDGVQAGWFRATAGFRRRHSRGRAARAAASPAEHIDEHTRGEQLSRGCRRRTRQQLSRCWPP
jgi:hypothetical protein